jgi:hypothetical protein
MGDNNENQATLQETTSRGYCYLPKAQARYSPMLVGFSGPTALLHRHLFTIITRIGESISEQTSVTGRPRSFAYLGTKLMAKSRLNDAVKLQFALDNWAILRSGTIL